MTSSCPHEYRWHLEKNATQMPAIFVRLTIIGMRPSISHRNSVSGNAREPPSAMTPPQPSAIKLPYSIGFSEFVEAIVTSPFGSLAAATENQVTKAITSPTTAPACPHDYCWHSWKHAAQTSAIIARLTVQAVPFAVSRSSASETGTTALPIRMPIALKK